MGSISSGFKIIVDAMGGDYAPLEIIKGAVESCKANELELYLVGKKDSIESAAEKANIDLKDVKIINADDPIKMDDSPSEILKYKKNSSIFIGTQLASQYSSSAFLSAGNTGAAMACSLFNIKKIDGVLRPAIAVVIPLADKKFVLIDAGANVEIKAVYLKQFAQMGKIYCKELLDIPDPKVGLLNVGSEEKKGSLIVAEGYGLLKDSDVNFIGNVEGRDIFEGAADVVVCDGFVGNIILKAIEGMAGLFFKEIKNIFTTNAVTKFSALMVKKYLKQMKKKFDYEEYGGALLIGINGVSIISHGSSRAKSISNAVNVAYTGLKSDIIGKIKEEVKH